jgi:hypothetical protein
VNVSRRHRAIQSPADDDLYASADIRLRLGRFRALTTPSRLANLLDDMLTSLFCFMLVNQHFKG